MKKKLLALGLAFSFLLSAVSVQALTSSELLQIAKILGLSDEQSAKLQVLVKEPIKGPVCFKFEKDLRIGDKGEEVLKLSKFLMGKGLVKVGANSWSGEVFDENLAEAVVKFQGQNGLPMTGFFGPMTRGKISSFICHPYGDDGLISTSSIKISIDPNDNANINAFINVIKPEKNKDYKLGEKIELAFKSNLSNIDGYVVSLRAGGSKEWFMESVLQIPYGKGESLGSNNYKVEAVISITPEIKKFMSDALDAGMKSFVAEVAGVKYVKAGFDIVKVNTSMPFFVKRENSYASSTMDKIEDHSKDEIENEVDEVEDSSDEDGNDL